MAASRNDSYQLSQDTVFQNRVQQSLIAACIAITNEGWSVAFHRERDRFAVSILAAGSTTNQNSFVVLFTNAVSTDTNVLADATVGGTVAITAASRAAQSLLVTDAHIDSAVSSMFNSFITEPNG